MKNDVGKVIIIIFGDFGRNDSLGHKALIIWVRGSEASRGAVHHTGSCFVHPERSRPGEMFSFLWAAPFRSLTGSSPGQIWKRGRCCVEKGAASPAEFCRWQWAMTGGLRCMGRPRQGHLLSKAEVTCTAQVLHLGAFMTPEVHRGRCPWT